MRSLTLIAASILLLAAPVRAHGQSMQGTIGASAQILAPEEVRVAAAAGSSTVTMERTTGGATRLSVPLVMTHRTRPTVSLQQRAGDPRCELLAGAVGGARPDAGWSTSLRCTAQPGAAPTAPLWARLVIVPNT